MDVNEKIYVAGHRGLVGAAIMRSLKEAGYSNLVTKTHSELDLTRQKSVEDFFAQERPDYVFLAAAKVGGIYANNTYPADFIRTNLMIQSNIIHSAYLFGVKKLLFLGSSCIYPKFSPQPIKEEYLLTGELEPTNESYAIAKIAGIKMCQAYNRQHGTNFNSVMPCNLYGPGDNFDPQNSHVLPALLRKFHDAKVRGATEVTIWGTGSPRREFLYSDDLADACIFLMNNYQGNEPINVGAGKDVTIKQLAEIIREVIGFRGRLVNDLTKPDGTPQKLMDISRISQLGWKPKTGLNDGIKQTYEWYLDIVDDTVAKKA